MLETRFLVVAGVVSYSIFLWQVPVIYWARDHGLTLAGSPGVVVNLAVLGTIVFVLSALSYRYVEYPALIRKGKAKRGHRVETPTEAQVQAEPHAQQRVDVIDDLSRATHSSPTGTRTGSRASTR